MWTDQYINNNSMYVFTRVMRTLTPNYFQLKESGGFIPPQPYRLFLDRSLKGTVTCLNGYADGRQYHPGYAPFITENFYWCDDDLLQRLKQGLPPLNDYLAYKDNKLLNKLKGASLPLIQLAKERNQTGGMVIDLLDRLHRAARHVRRPKEVVKIFRDLHPKRSQADLERVASSKLKRLVTSYKRFNRREIHVSDALLAYQFAWKPLMIDICDAMSANEASERKHTCSRASVTYDRSDSFSVPCGPNSGADMDATITRSYRGTQAVYYTVDNAFLSSIGMIQNLPATLWDFTPWSFVVDWFVNVSQWLDLQTATLGLSFTTGYKTILTKHEVSFSPRPREMDAWGWKSPMRWSEVLTLPPSGREQLSFERQLLHSFPSPKLIVDLGLPSNAMHVLEMLALLKQRASTAVYAYDRRTNRYRSLPNRR